MTTRPPADQEVDIAQLIAELLNIAHQQHELPEQGTPLGDTTRDFFRNNWDEAVSELLDKTSVVRVLPDSPDAPHRFRFEIDTPYKHKRSRAGQVDLDPGPVRGQILYRPDLFVIYDAPAVAVLLDPDQAYFHPNHCRRTGVLCIGDVPNGPYPLKSLIEHVYGILTYQNRRPSHPADIEAAAYFALEPDAMSGLESVRPLY